MIRASRMGVSPHATIPFRNFDEELQRPGVWETDQGSTSTAESSRDNLASLYRPPFGLMYHGPFEKVINDYFMGMFGLMEWNQKGME